jgi:hypothetical protein
MENLSVALKQAIASCTDDEVALMAESLGVDGSQYNLQDTMKRVLAIPRSEIMTTDSSGKDASLTMARIILRSLCRGTVEDTIATSAAKRAPLNNSKATKWTASVTKLFTTIAAMCGTAKVVRRLVLRALICFVRTFHCLPFKMKGDVVDETGKEAAIVMMGAVACMEGASKFNKDLLAETTTAMNAKLSFPDTGSDTVPSYIAVLTYLSFCTSLESKLLPIYSVLVKDGRLRAQMVHLGSMAAYASVDVFVRDTKPKVPFVVFKDVPTLPPHTDLPSKYNLLITIIQRTGELATQRLVFDVETQCVVHSTDAPGVTVLCNGPNGTLLGVCPATCTVTVWTSAMDAAPLGYISLDTPSDDATINWMHFDSGSGLLMWGCQRPATEVLKSGGKNSPLLWVRMGKLSEDCHDITRPKHDKKNNLGDVLAKTRAADGSWVGAFVDSFSGNSFVLVNDELLTQVPLMASAVYGTETSFDVVSARPPCIMRYVEGCMSKLVLPLHDVIIDAVPFVESDGDGDGGREFLA